MKHQYKFLSILLVAGLMTACSSEEPQGNQLPTGQYPLKVTATVGAPQSRSIGKDSWTGDCSETFGVRIGENGRVAKYVITDATGKAEAASGTTPLYWDNTAQTAVSAWLPCEPQTDVDISDQSTGFAAFDYLTAIAEGQSYLAPVSLQFKHKMAKVRCILKPGKGITEADLTSATVKFAGYTSATFAEGILTGSGSGWITPASDREALLIPQDMTGKEFISIEMGGNEYVYTPSNDNAGLIKEGLLHQYSITVNANGIEVSAVTGGEWTDGGEEDVPAEDVVETYSAEQLKIGDYFYADGTFSDGGLRYRLADGTFLAKDPTPVTGKNPVGIVYHLRNESSASDECVYTEFDSKLPTGYILSLDEFQGRFINSNPDRDDQTPKDKINGYKYTAWYYERYSPNHSLYAIEWSRGLAVVSSSDVCKFTPWYIPSFKEYDILRTKYGDKTPVLDLVIKNLAAASGTGISSGFYATCGVMGQNGNYLHVYDLITGRTDAGWGYNAITMNFRYRAVCAFRII